MPDQLVNVLGFIGTVAAAAALNSLVKWGAKRARSIRLSAGHRAILTKYAIHYQRLDPEERRRFEHKVSIFVNEKTWIGAGIAVAEEMKVMIAACAAQMLLGYPDVELKHFDRIVVYPGSYHSHRSGRRHQGEVRPRTGVIIISWDDFLHGYAHSRDAHNVGLHEMAHALWFENSIVNGEDNFLSPALLKHWIVLADGEIERIKNREDHFFRDYAGTDQAEFFAVAVEYFFEQPHGFQAALPELYGNLRGLLKQDPASVVMERMHP